MQVEDIAEALKVLGDSARLLILKELMRAKQEKSVGVTDLAKRLKISQPNVSHHLKVLKTAGFICCKKDQRFSYYTVEKGRIEGLLQQVTTEILAP